MTGTGTENDPFVVANWDDFLTIDTINTVYVKWQDIENKVIDFNEIKPDGFKERMIFPRYIDFNGWTLKNFHASGFDYVFYAHSSSNLVNLKNLIFENFYLTDCIRLFYYVNLENCIISGIFNSNSNMEIESFGNITNSSFNIKAVTPAQFTFFNGKNYKIKNSDVRLDVSAKKINILNSENCNAYNCRFSGKIESSSGEITLKGDLGNIYNLEASDPLNYTGTGISVYNSDFATVTSSSNFNLKPCTSDELKDPEFLYNLGFPIGID